MLGADGRGGVAQDLAVVVDGDGVGEGIAGAGGYLRVEVHRVAVADDKGDVFARDEGWLAEAPAMPPKSVQAPLLQEAAWAGLPLLK